MTDKDLIFRCQGGDLHYFENIFDRYQNDLFKYCLYLSRNGEDAADLYQDTWLRALNKIKTCNPDINLKKWLITIATNLYRDKWRRQKRFLLLLTKLPRPSYGLEIPYEDIELLQNTLARLPEGLRIPMVLFYLEDMNIGEVAEVMKIPTGTVKSRLHHGRQRLKQIMEVSGGE